MSVLTGQKERVAAWVASKIRDLGSPPDKDYEAIGVVKNGRLVGGVIYSLYTEIAPGEHDIHITGAGEPGWLTRGRLKILFEYAFVQLACIRMSATVAKGNRHSRDICRRLGFIEEGCIRDGLGTGRDAIHYGMKRGECRYLGNG